MSPGIGLTILGIPVRMGAGVFLGLLVLGVLSRFEGLYLVEWIVLALAALLLHELGHALAFRRYGMASRIEFWALGGLTIPVDQGAAARLPDRQLFVVSIAGPLVGLVIGGGTLAVWTALGELPGYVSVPLFIWTFVNLGWAIFNLLPIGSLDGGRALAHLAGAAFGRAGRVAGLALGLAFSALITVIALASGEVYLAFIAIAFGLVGSVGGLLDEIRSGGAAGSVGRASRP